MKWDDIQLEAKRRKCLIYAVDQAQSPPMTQPGPWGPMEGGYCAGLAANWIALAYDGKDFPYASEVCDYPPWQATRAQNIYADADWTTWLQEWKVLAGDFQCTVGHHAALSAPPTAEFICSVVYRSYGCYGISFSRGPEPPSHPDAGGHCVAIRNGRDGRLHLFDPNYFHVAMHGPEHFKHFVKWWLKDTGYHKRYRLLTGVAGIRPPINHSHP